ncbi:PepSY domain-containing protein [Rhodobacteraceae bacterium HSP-20]|uniref:PepSY domain-containing protein n=1 Tax=Paragemmobacter amnigenus TaxID=2852097 RepID=A0ABS6J622_9RHOB|nr:PepSY domain-containing protein [Rhodobacter amnigenus]MBU9698671.1 PepSY domain-containing protein [Rhodobacter amnigenus]MBV4389898.1 PepSY domain-containing protein [Rhodobacter amnigenus]
MIRLSTSLVIAGLLAATPLRADDDCAVPMADWQPRAAVERFAAAQGWHVTRIRLDDGCYEVIGTDATGRHIEAKLDPSRLTVIELEYEDHGEGGGSHDGTDD